MMRPGDSEFKGASGLGRPSGWSQPSNSTSSELLCEVVAELIGLVDPALDCGQRSVGNLGGAGLVLNVPEIEVGPMLAGDGNEPAGPFSFARLRRAAADAMRGLAGRAVRRLRWRRALWTFSDCDAGMGMQALW